MSLYAGVGLLVVLCALIAVGKTVWDLKSGRLSLPLTTWREVALAPAKLWWRWQINYLTGAPVILLAAALFVHHIGLSVFLDV